MNKFLIILVVFFFSSTLFGQKTSSGIIQFTDGEKLKFESIEGVKSHYTSGDPYNPFIYIHHEGDEFYKLELNILKEIHVDEILPDDKSHFKFPCMIKTNTGLEVETIANLSSMKNLVLDELSGDKDYAFIGINNMHWS